MYFFWRLGAHGGIWILSCVSDHASFSYSLKGSSGELSCMCVCFICVFFFVFADAQNKSKRIDLGDDPIGRWLRITPSKQKQSFIYLESSIKRKSEL
jgi:hypothetical protein